MEVDATGSGSKDVEGEVGNAEESQGDNAQEPEQNSRPSTPSMPIFDILPKNEDEWWRPSVPPETWKFEEIRRQRQKGGYPWTHLDKEDTDIEADQDYLDDNLYEPVNPPGGMYASGSSAAVKDPLETGSLDGRRFEIPPEIDIITSDGLDGLDLPDRHCFDGDKEWVHSDEEPSTSISVPPKALFTAGIRPGDAKASDSSTSSMRPLTNKSISFAPDAQDGEESQPMEQDQEVPSGSHGSTSQATGAVPKKTTTAFEILKSKAAGAADSVKQRFKIGLPTRQKLSKEESAKLRRRPRKKGALEQEQEVPEDIEVREEEGEMEVAEQAEPPATETAEMETDVQEEESKEELVSEKAAKEEALRKEKEAKEEALRKEKEAKEEALRKEKEAKEEEKLRKQKEQEEIKRQKAEEKQQAKEEAQRKKAEEKLAKQKAAEEAKKAAEEAKKAKLEEQLAKAKEAQELKRQKEEEELKRIREQEAQAKEVQEKKRLEEEQRKLREEEEAKVKAEEAKLKAKEAEEKKQEEAKQKAKEAEERKQEEAQRKLVEQETSAAAAELSSAKVQASSPETDAATVTVEQSESSAAAVQGDVEMEEEAVPEIQPTPSTPTGTGKRKVKKMTFPQMPHLPKMPDLPTLPHIDLDFRRKVIKRSKTPPARPQPPKSKGKGAAVETENQLAAQYENEILARNAAMEEDNQEEAQKAQAVSDPQTQIYVTQPSTEQQLEESETHVEWEPNLVQGGEAQEEPSTSKKQPVPAKERLDKFGKSLKGFGSKSKEVASQKSKAMGQKMKVIGKDLQKFGVKVNEKYQSTIEEIKAKQEAAKARSKQKALEAEDAEDQMEYEGEYPDPESSTEPRRTFRFRRRDESQEESEEADSNKPQAYYENSGELRGRNEGEEGAQDDSKLTRSQLLGRAERDWESPLELQQSRDVSEEPFSGNASSRDSPPGSSMASSTFAHVRKQGVLEEIDSDEFFLREKGISEGEDEEEINRFLVEELRQAFRPQANNALAGFDMPESPDRPERLPRKPPRKEKEDKVPSYQTFPPERPRRKAPGYVSAYMNQEQEEQEQDQDSQVEERGSPQDDLREYDDDGMRDLKEDVELLNQEQRKLGDNEGYEDDGRYEPVNEEPIKPVRAKKGPKQPTTPVYYNTVAGNEWMRDLEDQVEVHEEASPRPPQRERRKSSRSNQFSELSETPLVEDMGGAQGGSQHQLTGAESDGRFTTSEVDPDDGFEYVDEAGYAVVHKDRDVPRTIPRKKKSGSKGSLKRRSPEQQKSEEATGSDPMFFSLPRQAPKTFHVTPPSRPQRNYSTLRPRRPPRNKSSPRPDRRKGIADGSRDQSSPKPSTAIGIMQGRPLPPPPRPERSPIPMNDLDMSTIERSVGARHYANFDEGNNGRAEVVEEVLTATNIPLLGRQTETTDDDITIGIQTDPLHQEEQSNEAVTRSYATDSSRVQRQSDSLKTTTTASENRDTRTERPRSPVPPREIPSQPPQSTPQFVFPTRLHLQELEVDVLRVNDLSAHSINVEHLSAPQLQVNSLTATGSLSVVSIHTQTLNSDQVNCNRLSSDTVDLPSIPPASFHQLSSPDDEPSPPQQPTQPSTEPPEELRLNATEKEDAENESSFPYIEREQYGNNLNRDQTKEEPFDKYDESALIGDISEGDLKFSVDETQEGEDFAQYTPQDSTTVPDDGIKSEEASSPQEDLNIPVEDLPIERETFRSSALDLMNEEYLEQPDVDFSTVKEEEKFAYEPMYQSSSPSGFCTSPHIEQSISLEDEILEGNIQISYTLPNDDAQPSMSQEGSIDFPEEESSPIPSSVHIIPSEEEEEESVVQVKVTLQDLIDQRKQSSSTQQEAPPPKSSQPDPEIEEIKAPAPTPVLEVQMPRVSQPAAPTRQPTPPRAPTNTATRSPAAPQRQPTPPKSQVVVTPQVTAAPPVAAAVAAVQQAPRQNEPEDIIQLGMRLGRALTRLTMRGLQAMIDYVDTATSDDPSKAEQQKANLQVLLCVILMVVAALLLSTRSGPSSFNRWEFYMPPPEL